MLKFSGLTILSNSNDMNITDSNIFAMKPGDAMTGMSTHTFYNEPDVQSLKNGLKVIYHSHNKEEEVFSKKDAINMINTWDKVAKDYASIFEELRNRENIVRY